MEFKSLKIEAKQALVGNRLMFLLVILVAAILSGVPVVGIIVSPILTAGVFVVGKLLLKERQVQFEPIFTYFKDFEHGLKIFVVNILVALMVIIGLIIFIIPGIVLALKYSQALFIMSENKDMDIMDALKESSRMMKGYKWNLFLFGLSFILHILLGMITFGLYMLYAMPYIYLSGINYYQKLKALQADKPDLLEA